MKKLALTTMLIIASQLAFSQIGKTLEEVKNELGSYFDSGLTPPNGNNVVRYFITYKQIVQYGESEKYVHIKMFFFNSDKPNEKCVQWLLFAPKRYKEVAEKSFNESMKRLNDDTWKDTVNNLYYNISTNEELCNILCFPKSQVESFEIIEEIIEE